MIFVSALIGIHLIEPFLTLTHYKAVTYEELIPISKELYNDFQTTDASDLHCSSHMRTMNIYLKSQ